MAGSISSSVTPLPPPQHDATLIIGGGIAGIFAALKLAPHPVTILTAAPFGEGASSAWAQGGMAAAVGEGDTAEKHLADTLVAGAGIVDEAVAHVMTSEARARIEDLLAYGVPFDRDLEGKLQTGREAAHSERRIVHVNGDTAGKAIMAALIEAVRQTPSIRVIENFVAERLTLAEGRVTGVLARGQRGAAANAVHFPASAVVLATGGIGHLYAVTTNPAEANGNGVALAARAGAMLADLEFVQFHPTAVDIGRDPAPLATEALRGEGAVLVNAAGDRFMLAIHPDGELAPRDIVARAIHAELAGGRGAFLDCREAIGARFASRFPTVHAACLTGEIDPVTMPIPMAPAEHYHMGGVLTDVHGRTTVPGLWACGEVASTGVHGANRLASNSLLEAVVFATRVAADIAALDPAAPDRIAQDNIVATLHPAVPEDAEVIAALRRIMAEDVGVIRHAEGLQRALDQIGALERRVRSATVQNMLLVARLIALAALNRKESRGGHYRSDFPDADPAQASRSFMALAGGPDRAAAPIKKAALA